jgi:hypothetical protein
VDVIRLAQDTVQRWNYVSTVNLGFHKSWIISWLAEQILAFQEELYSLIVSYFRLIYYFMKRSDLNVF